jgi:hypothetical protein
LVGVGILLTRVDKTIGSSLGYAVLNQNAGVKCETKDSIAIMDGALTSELWSDWMSAVQEQPLVYREFDVALTLSTSTS